MAATPIQKPTEDRSTFSDTTLLVVVGLAVVLIHTIANGQYGFHRDELQTWNNAQKLSWGYIEYPPFTPFIGRIELALFGTSLRGFRFFAALAQGLTVIFSGLATRELGGKREAQLLAATSVAIGGHTLFAGSFLSYTSFDYFWWMLTAYFVIRLLNSGDARWWIGIGSTMVLA
jgi:dolichyl-phosphate-mannose--protein O-mannosyl transferase